MKKTLLNIDIVSDVVCPWCIIGYKYLEKAMAETADQVSFQLRWQPFELNPNMGAEGQNLREHLAEKYGTTLEGSIAARARITDLGARLGFTFDYTDDMRIYNTFKAHQLLHWAGELGKQTPLKMALFSAYFSLGRNLGEEDVLLDCVEKAGLPREQAKSLLAEGRYREVVRQRAHSWLDRGIRGVPAVIFQDQYLVSGAQETSAFRKVIARLLEQSPAQVEG